MPKVPPHRLNVAAHAIGLRADFPDSEIHMGNGWIRWIGQLQPTGASMTYRVMVEYSGQPRPKVLVIEPKLEIAHDGEEIPHVFNEGESLCLHYNHEWDPSKSLASTVIPWTVEWLFHYEVWLATGKWTGGGHEPRRRTSAGRP